VGHPRRRRRGCSTDTVTSLAGRPSWANRNVISFRAPSASRQVPSPGSTAKKLRESPGRSCPSPRGAASPHRLTAEIGSDLTQRRRDRDRLARSVQLLDVQPDRRHTLLNGRTLWLDVRRHPSPAQRLAVLERDQTCRFTTPDGVRCERPWQWSDVHHVDHHGNGGPTLTPNLALLCVAHHHAVHEGGWTITGNADSKLTFHPPSRPPPQRRS